MTPRSIVVCLLSVVTVVATTSNTRPVLAQETPAVVSASAHEVSSSNATCCSQRPCGSCDQCCGPAKTLFSWGYGQPNSGGAPGRDEPLVTDRPDFTEASVTVGRGVAQLEAGYTYSFDDEAGTSTKTQTYLETLLRAGVLAEWFELRVGWTYIQEETTTPVDSVRNDGGDDLYLGVKLALTPQRGLLPEMALIPQMFVPAGADIFTAGQVLPGVNWLYSWEISDCFSIGGSTQGNRDVDDTGHGHTVWAQSITGAFSLTERVGAYTEWFAFFPHSAVSPSAQDQHFLNGGFTYLVNNDLQIDVRMGVGLNREAENYFTGVGFSLRR